MSKSRDYADLKQDLDDSAFSGSYNDLDDTPTIPSALSQLTNDANYTQNGVTSVNGQSGSSVSLSLNNLSDVDTSAAGTQKFLTKSGSTHVYSTVNYNNLANLPTSLTDFTNDISEVTTTTPTSGAGKPVGYVWYVI